MPLTWTASVAFGVSGSPVKGAESGGGAISKAGAEVKTRSTHLGLAQILLVPFV